MIILLNILININLMRFIFFLLFVKYEFLRLAIFLMNFDAIAFDVYSIREIGEKLSPRAGAALAE